jgi:PAS domain S-box-containing protein
MKEKELNIESLLGQIEALKDNLYEANSIIEAIRDGGVDALVLNKNGNPQVYAIESADYTYRILIEKMGEGALSISDEGLILYCNEHFSRMIGIPANKLTGTFFNDYVDSVDAYKKLKEGLINGPSKGEIVINGFEKKLHVYISLTDLHPNIPAIGAVITDLTEKRQHEEALMDYQDKLETKVNELNQTNINLEQFIHVISHDLKEPLRKIITYTSHLNDTQSDSFSLAQAKSLNVINSSAHRLNSLVDDLVKYAFSAIATELVEVDLNKIVEEVIEDLELVVREKNAKITNVPLPVVMSSKVQMRQLFSNLLSNAIKYSRKDVHPEISIQYEKANHGHSFFKISISDNGIGINENHLNKIFTIFQRLHMREEYSGNGIGLAICRKIMENHKGRIEVESKENQGSVFNLYFPIHEL